MSTLRHTAKVLLTLPANKRSAEITCSFVGYKWTQSVDSLDTASRCISCGEIVKVWTP